MKETDDIELLQRYVDQNSEEAFAALVTRHLNLVYSVAMRHVQNPHHAEEITQAVFVILARKSGRLHGRVVLSGWLYHAARLTAANFLRRETQRARREHEAYMQSILNESEPDVWPQLAPMLDAAMAGLGERDRDAIVLRFFEGRRMNEIGAALGTSEDAAKKRVTRAVEKLRKFFAKRGVVVPVAVLTTAISANSVQAAPVALAKTTTVVALAKGATASATTLTLIKGALKLMAWTKTQTAIVAGAVVLIAAGTTITVKKVNTYERDRNSWLTLNLTSGLVDQSVPQVRILPTRFPRNPTLWGNAEFTKWGGLDQPVSTMMWVAYQWPPARMVFTAPEPQGGYDFIASLPQGSYEALQRELKDQFGLVGRVETRDEDVLVLRVRTPNAPGLKPPKVGGQNDWNVTGHYVCDDCPLSTDTPPYRGLQRFLEGYFNVPVVNETGLTNDFSIDLKWRERGHRDPNHDALKQALADQLGLELVPASRSIEMLIVEKAK